MPKFMYAFLFLFLFLITFTPAYAYLPVDKNVSYSGSASIGMACTNNTGTFYCYVLEFGSPPSIIRYNSTLGGPTTCVLPCVGACAGTYWLGLSVVNTTHLISRYSTSGYRLIGISNMSACTSSDTLTPAFNDTSGGTFAGGYYNIDNNNESAWIYWGSTNGIRNSTTNEWLSVGFWDSNIKTLRLPDQKNNYTIYGYYSDLFFKYVAGAFDSYTIQPSQTWGLPEILYGKWDLWNETASTTWLYSLPGDYAHDRIYRVNYTMAEILGESYIVAVDPTGNETISDSTPNLHAIVYSASNGTVGWYVDGVFKTNETLITDGVSADVYYTVPVALTEGNHYWKAYFYPSVGYSFDTGTQYFIYSTSGYSGDEGTTGLKDWLDAGMGSNFGSDIVSLIVAGVCAILLFVNVKSHDKSAELVLGTFLLVASIFSFVGLLTSWFLVLEVTLIGVVIFWKAKGG